MENFITRAENTVVRALCEGRGMNAVFHAFFIDHVKRGITISSKSIDTLTCNEKEQESFKKLTAYFSEKEYIKEELPDTGSKYDKNEDSKAVLFTHSDTSGDIDVLAMVVLKHSLIEHSTEMEIRLSGKEEHIAALDTWIKENIRNDKICTVTTITTINKQDGCVGNLRDDFIGTGKDNLAHDCFYPNTGIGLKDYFKAFMDSDESVLLLYGPPGGGKTTFIRSLLIDQVKEAWLAYDMDVLKDPILYSDFMDSDANVLVCEDIDRLLGKRKDGNNLMSSLLNSADGVVKKPNKKFILSTNLESLDDIDSALIREGRCFDTLHFEKLTMAQAKIVIDELNLPHQDLQEDKKYTLANILTPVVPGRRIANRFKEKPRMGFM